MKRKQKRLPKSNLTKYLGALLTWKRTSAKLEVTSILQCTHSENERLKEMLEWAEEDLVQEQEEVEDLKEMMRRKKEILTTYRFVTVLLFACMIGLILQNMGVLP